MIITAVAVGNSVIELVVSFVEQIMELYYTKLTDRTQTDLLDNLCDLIELTIDAKPSTPQ